MATEVGKKAPAFASKDQDGKEVKLADLKGKKVILYFYPKDMTSGCTAEACNLRDNYNRLRKEGYEVLGVSTDGEASHRKFIEKEKLPFRLLADTDKALHTQFGTWVEKSMYGRKYMGTARKTFIIDEAGKVSRIIDKVDTRNHTEQILGSEGPEPAGSSKGSKRPAPSRKKPAARRK
jgi:peroxiredoxin Q/BCP